MQVKELKKDGLQHEMEITVTAKDIDSRVESRLQEVGKTMKMPGFRPGKVPLAMLKARYGRAIMGEVLEITVNETTGQVLKERNLRPAIQPKIEVKSFDEGKDLTFLMTVEVLPQIKLADFKAIKLTRPVAKVDAKEVDTALERIAQGQRRSQPVTEDRASRNGDTVVIDFRGRTADDNVEHPGMEAKGHALELGSGMFIPGFEEQLIGKKAGADVAVDVTFPEEYGAKELAGRKAIFEVKIHELRELAPFVIDEGFAKNLGFDTTDALRKAVEEQIGKEYAAQGRLVVKKALMDYLDDNHPFAAPASMLDLEFQNIMDQLKMERQQAGETEDMSEAEKAEFKSIADRRVRVGLVLAEIGTQNNIQVTDPELQRAVIAEAQRYPGQQQQVFDFYAKNRHALEGIRARVFEDKVVDFILELAKIDDKYVTAQDLMKMLDQDEEIEETPKKSGSEKAAKAKGGESAKKKK